MRVLAVVALALAGTACGQPASPSGEAPTVAASFYPLAFVATAVAGDGATVVNLTPAGGEPHDLELTPGQVATLARADLVVYLGAGFQPAVEDALGEAGGATIDAVGAAGGLLGRDEEGGADPHVWLDPTRLAGIAGKVGGALSEVHPAGADGYRRRAAGLRVRLKRLDEDFNSRLSDCRRREIVTSHEAFGYLAARYDLRQIGIAGIDPESEPAPQRVAEVAGLARRHGATTIFFERLVSPRIAETVAEEIDVETAVLDPLEGPPAGSKDYFDAMSENLAALTRALGCT